MGYRSLVFQTLHYFSRPQEAVCREPIRSAAAWRGGDFAGTEWRESFSAAEVAEIRNAIDAASATGKPTSALQVRDFPLPTLHERIARWVEVLARGRGFVVVGGLPAEAWPQADLELFFWCLGLHLGIPGAQNPRGDLLGHVRDEGVAPGPKIRQYRTAEAIDYHCDTADVVGLLCVRRARAGGESRIASSVTVYNEVLAKHPDLVDALYEPFQLDTRSEGGLDILPVAPCRYAAGQLRTFFHTDYFRSAPQRPGARPLTQQELAVLDAYAEVLARPDVPLHMELEVGDVQLVSNHTIVHGRSGYEEDDDPVYRRHLLRLWLSLEERRPLGWRLRKERDRLRVLRQASSHWLQRWRP